VKIKATIDEFTGEEQKNFVRPFSLLIGVDLIVDDKITNDIRGRV